MTITGGAISGVDASFSKVKDEGTTETTTHTGTTVTAADTLTMQSGNDTTITGSKVSGTRRWSGVDTERNGVSGKKILCHGRISRCKILAADSGNGSRSAFA